MYQTFIGISIQNTRYEMLDTNFIHLTPKCLKARVKVMKQNNTKKSILEKKLSSIHVKSEEEQAKKLAKKNNLPYFNIASIAIDPQIMSIIDEKDARQANLAVIGQIGRKLHIGILDPENQASKKIIENLKNKGFIVKIFIISLSGLNISWQKYKEVIKTHPSKAGKTILQSSKLDQVLKQIKNLSDLKDQIRQTDITELLNIVLAGAIQTKVSDIHIEPSEEKVKLRYRLDGILQDICFIPIQDYKSLVSRLKILSELKININNFPQNGHFALKIDELEIDIRVSTLPGPFGETVVLRILDSRVASLSLKELGFQKYDLLKIENVLKKPYGMILTTGPTGSGKTTTLYAFLKKLYNPGIKIITLEDPIEYKLPGVSQTQINEKAGYTFEIGLKNALRQDPDVILLGEIRGQEAGKTALDAALTGHRVLSTLHTNNAWGAIPRLIQMDIPIPSIASALNLVMAQRLVRRLCKKCKKEINPSPELIEKITNNLPRDIKSTINSSKIKIAEAVGCSECNNTGYKGRIGIYEIFNVTEEMQKLILSKPNSKQIKEFAMENNIVTMYQDGILKVLDGITTIEEVERMAKEE